MKQLKDIAHYVTEKVEVASLSSRNYISTENMLKDKQGVTFDASLPDAAKVTKFSVGDVLVSNIRPYFKKIYQAERNGGCSNDVIVFRTNDDNVYRQSFLFYVLSQDYFFDYMTAGSNGTKMPRGNKKLIPLFPVPDFTIAVQDKIVNLLADYDNLIEKCRRQIVLLEEAAHRTYNEWFVKMRFPGYEKANFINGLSEGWERRYLGEVATIKAGKDRPVHFSPIKKEGFNIPVYSNGIDKFGLYGYTNRAEIIDDSVTVSARGTIGFVCLRKSPFVPIVRLLSITPNKTTNISAEYLYLSLKSLKIDGNGSATQQVTVPQFKKNYIIIPSNDISSKFNKIVNPIYEAIINLRQVINNAYEARDILLPRLINGEITI